MILGIGVDMYWHSYNNPYIYGLRISDVNDKGSMDQRNTENEHKILHLGNYTETLSRVLKHCSPLLSVIC